MDAKVLFEVTKEWQHILPSFLLCLPRGFLLVNASTAMKQHQTHFLWMSFGGPSFFHHSAMTEYPTSSSLSREAMTLDRVIAHFAIRLWGSNGSSSFTSFSTWPWWKWATTRWVVQSLPAQTTGPSPSFPATLWLTYQLVICYQGHTGVNRIAVETQNLLTFRKATPLNIFHPFTIACSSMVSSRPIFRFFFRHLQVQLFTLLSTFPLQITQDHNKATTNSYDCFF